MTVTAVMSTYNGEKYLKEQIDSILCQKNVDIKLFVRDDGSCDGTQKIIREYAANHENICFLAGKNIGAGRSFYEALKQAPESPYYAFADQDDIWLPNKLITAINALESFGCSADETPLLYTCRTIPVDSELRPLDVRDLYAPVSFGSALLENRVSGCTFVFSRKAKELFLMLPAECICIHDWDMLRIILAVDGKVYQDEKGYVLYRQHRSNAVGAGVSYKRRAEKLFRGHLLEDLKSRLAFADIVRRIYSDSIPEKNREILDRLCDYKKSFSARFSLVRSKEIVRKDLTDNLFCKALFLFGFL